MVLYLFQENDHRNSILVNSYLAQTFNNLDQRASVVSQTQARLSLIPNIQQSTRLFASNNANKKFLSEQDHKTLSK